MTTKKDISEAIYPCKFKVKVIGVNQEELEKVIIRVMSSYGELITSDQMSMTYSKNNKYVSITYEIVAKSLEHIEQIYSELNAQKEVTMVM
jgi:uncharacterized protein